MDVEIQRTGDNESTGKRRATTTEEWATNKKRVLDSMTGSPISSTNDEKKEESQYGKFLSEPEDEEKVEAFRKAAIFRRMKYYQREFNRALERIGRLEESLKRSNLERIQAETCWTSTVETIRQLVPLESMVEEAGQSVKTIFPSRIFTAEDYENVEKMSQDKIQDTEKAIHALVKLAGKVDRPDYDTLFSECQELQKSNAFLTAEADATFARMNEIREERDKYAEELRDALSRVDRLQSRKLDPFPCKDPVIETSSKGNGELTKESGSATPVGSVSRQETEDVAMLDANQLVSSIDEEQLRYRDERIAELERDQVKLRSRNTELEIALETLPEHVIAKSKSYQLLLCYAARQSYDLKTFDSAIENYTKSKKQMYESRVVWQQQMEFHLGKEAEEAKSLLQKREDDLNRIRQIRDQLEAQLKEATAKLESKWSAVEKYKALVDTQGAQITQLNSEVQRLRTRLASNAGDEDLHAFLWKDPEINTTYVDDIRRRLSETHKELESLRATVRDRDQMTIDAASLRVRLKELEKENSRLKSSSNGELDTKLKTQDDELRTLRLQVTQNAQEMEALMSEMDNLSNSLESTRHELHNQVITLEKWEEEKDKLVASRARSENKYYKMMTEHEAKDAERKVASRNFEKQVKLVEHLKETEKGLRKDLDDYQNEILQLKDDNEQLRKQIRAVEHEKDVLAAKLADAELQTEALRKHITKMEEEVVEIRLSTDKLKDELRKAKKEAEKLKRTQASVVSQKPSEDTREEEGRAQALLKCSTCNLRFRNTIIAKCLHTFCKECVDQQITQRSRKCPFCAKSFGLSEVHTLYLQ